MAAPLSGWATAIGVGKESTWGTPVARATNWVRTAKWALKRNQERAIVGHLTHDDSGSVQEEYVVREVAGGSISFPLRYVGVHGYILEAAFGLNTTTGGGSPYTHTLTMAPTLPALTLEGRRGNSGNSEVLEGCKVNRLTISGSAGEPVMVDADFICQTGAARGTSGTAAFGAGELVCFHQASTLGWNGVTYVIKSFSLEMTNGLERVDEMGSKLTAEPGFNSRREVRLKVSLSHRVDTLYVAQNADTEADATLTFTGATSPNAFAITLKNARLWLDEADISGPGYITENIEFLGKGAGATGACIVVMTTGTATHYGG